MKVMKMKDMKRLLAALLLTVLAGCSSAPTMPLPAGLTESGTVTIRQDQLMHAAAGVAGEGTLVFEGWQHTFTLEGAKIDIVNADGVIVKGVVYNLDTVEEFAGTFNPSKSEFEAGEGLVGVWAKNENGVVIHLSFRGEDIQVDLAAKNGAKVILK